MGDEYFFSVIGVAIASAKFTDADLWSLERGYEIHTLRLTDTHVSDTGLERLRHLTNLTTLELKRTDITDEGLRSLKRFANLQDLNLVDTEITDEGLAHVTDLQQLERLWIGKLDVQGVKDRQISEITDAGLSNIERLKKLKTLVLRNTRITSEEIDRLRRARPALRIDTGHGSRPNRRGNRFIEAESRWVPEDDFDSP